MIILKIFARIIFFYGDDSPLYQQIALLTFHKIMDKLPGNIYRDNTRTFILVERKKT